VDRSSSGPKSKLKILRKLKITFESSTMVLTNVAAFGVAVGVTVLAAHDEHGDES
jgi:hypothetical protein